MSAKCRACNKTAYPLEQMKFSNLIFHKGCFKCSTCGVRLRPEVTKQLESTGQIFCERDWNEGGHGGIGVKHAVGNDSMLIANAKKHEQVRRDATMGDSHEIKGGKAGQQLNSQQHH